MEEFERLLKQAKTICYKDRQGNYISTEKWQELLADPSYRIVKQDTIGKYFISTIWLGHVCWPGNYYYESTVFLGEQISDDYEIQRYTSEDQALAGHEDILLRYREFEKNHGRN